MFSFPPEFPFVSGRKADVKPQPAAPQPVAAQPPAAPEPAANPEPVLQTQKPKQPAEPPRPAPLLQSAVSRPERRKLKRDALATSALLRIDGLHGPPIKIELADISIAGASFRCPRPLEVGEKAQVRLEIGPFRWTTRLRIVHCARIDGDHGIVGCAFLRTELLRPWPAAA